MSSKDIRTTAPCIDDGSAGLAAQPLVFEKFPNWTGWCAESPTSKIDRRTFAPAPVGCDSIVSAPASGITSTIAVPVSVVCKLSSSDSCSLLPAHVVGSRNGCVRRVPDEVGRAGWRLTCNDKSQRCVAQHWWPKRHKQRLRGNRFTTIQWLTNPCRRINRTCRPDSTG